MTGTPARIEADYWIESAFPLAEAAEAMAGEQSSGTFLPLPGETPELKERSAARVTAIEDLGEVGSSRVDLQACKLEYSIVSPK